VTRFSSFDFNFVTGSPDFGTAPEGYRNARTLNTLACQGGNSVELCSTAQLGAWKDTLQTHPSPVKFDLFDFTVLFPEPIRTSVKTAINVRN
jgi:hypothetical protein